MKQTNNAIKFLMAQYRAIFKNANIAMAVALATAALAAGQAQAVDHTDWTQLTGDIAVTDQDTFTISGDGAVTNANGFNVSIGSGAAGTIKGNTAHGAFSLGEGVTGTITLDAGAGAAADAKLTIGDSAAAANTADVTITSFTNTKGTLEIAGSGAATGEGSSLNAKTITLSGAAAADSVTTVKAHGLLNATEILNIGPATVTVEANGKITAGSINMTDGELTVAGDASATTFDLAKGAVTVDGSLTAGTINLNSGTVTLNAAAAKLGNASSVITIAGAEVKDATAAGGTITGSQISLNKGGKITVTSGSTINGNFVADGGNISIANGKTLTIIGTATLADGTLNNTATNSGAMSLAATNATDVTTLNLSTTEAKSLFAGGVKASGDGAGVLNITGDTELDLSAAGLGILQDADGKFAAAKATAEGNATLKIAGSKAKFTAFNTIDAEEKKVVLAFDELTLGSGDVNLVSGAGVEIGKTLTINKGDNKLTVEKGTVTLNGTGEGSVAAKGIDLSGAAAGEAVLGVSAGTWSVKDLTLTKGTANVAKDGVLNVGGALTIGEATSAMTVDGILSTVGSGSLAATAGSINLNAGSTMKVDGADILDSKNALVTSKLTQGVLMGSGILNIDLGKDASGAAIAMTEEQFKALQTATGFNGIFETNVAISEIEGELTEDLALGNLKTDAYDSRTLTTADGTLDKSYSVGNVMVKAEKDLTLGTGANLVLTNASAENGKGNFVNKMSGSGTTVAGVTFSDAANSLTLVGSGQIASVTTSAANGGAVVVGMAADATQAGHVTVVKGNSIGAAGSAVNTVTLNEGSSLNVESGSIFTNNLGMLAGSVANVTGDISTATLSFDGASLTANSLTISDAAAPTTNVIDGGSVVDVDTFALGNNHALVIGQDGVPGSDPVDLGSTANVFTQSLTMGTGSSIFVDPSYGLKAATFVTNDIDAAGGTAGNNVAENIVIGKNAAFGIGFADLAQFEALMADYTDANGSFSDAEGRAQNALILNKGITVANGAGINVDSTLTQATATATADTVNLGAGSVMVLTDAAFGAAKDQAAITFANAGTVTSNATAKVVLSGDFDAGDTALRIAQKADGSATGVGSATVEYAGGILLGTLNADGTYSLVFQQDKADQIYNGISRPVGDFIVGKLKDEIAVDQNAAGFKFFKDNVFTTNNWALADTIAHAATYAGAQQAAVASVTTMAEAVGGRVGVMGVEAASISATGSQANGGVWVTPMYKSVDAEGFDAQGGSYGADVDLAGVAFGTDTVNGNMRFGAVFNIGSGDTDGKGAGAGLQDEFDYYGFGIYSVMGFGNFAVVGDASLNVISHDVSGAGLSGKADTTAVTMGVTGQYTIATPSVDVTPHLGARFIRLDTDSYDLNHLTGTIATTDFDVQNVFSVPLGVTLSKAFTAGSWSLAPSADLSITFNTGDTEAGSTTRINGYQYDITMDTEVLDEVQYGLTLGLGAQSGAFGTSFGINYTGSSNTDSFGVNAQARYVF